MSPSTAHHDGHAAALGAITSELGPGDVSVAELQQALRHLRGQPSQGPAFSTDGANLRLSTDDESTPAQADMARGGACAGCHHNTPTPAGAFDREWIVVLAAHSGAGASTIALGLLDAMAAAGRRPTLVETGPASRSALVAAAEAELGIDSSGQWLRGRRGTAHILRPAPGTSPSAWPDEVTNPAPGASPNARSTVVDHGLASPVTIDCLDERPRTVLVARATIPGQRQAEQVLTQLHPSHPTLLVTIGDSPRSRPARASEGPRIQQLRQAGAVMHAPLDRRLEVRGLSSDPLPKPLNGACSQLLALLDQLPVPTTSRGPANDRPVPSGKDPA